MSESFVDRIRETMTQRQKDYAPPEKNHQLTADLLSLWLSNRLGVDVALSPEDVCMINVLQKASRLAEGTHDDGWLDIVGYAENVAQLRRGQRNG